MVSLIWQKNEEFLLPSRGTDSVPTYSNTFSYGKSGDYCGSVDQRTMSVREPFGPYPKTMRTRIRPEWSGGLEGHATPQWLNKGRSSGTTYENQRELYAQYDPDGANVATNWPLMTFNSLRFSIKFVGDVRWDLSSYSRITGLDTPARGPGNVGTYMRLTGPSSQQEDRTDYWSAGQGKGSDGHGYHYFSLPETGDLGWVNVIITRQTDAIRGWSKSSSGPMPLMVEPYYIQMAGLNSSYFDVMSDIYLQQNGLPVSPLPGADAAYMYVTPFEYFTDTISEELEHLIGSTSCILNDANNTMQVGVSLTDQQQVFPLPAEHGFTCRIACKFGSTTYGDDFDTLIPLGEYVQNDIAYTWFCNDLPFDWDALSASQGGGPHDVVYIAFAVKDKEGELGHKEFAVCRDDTQLPPLPGENPA